MKFINWAIKYNKLWISLLGAILTALSAYFPDSQYLTLAISIAIAFGVYVIPNKTPIKV